MTTKIVSDCKIDYRIGKDAYWALDKLLAPIIHDGLVQFKNAERAGCYPTSLLPQGDTQIDVTDEEAEEASKKWESILDSMIHAFAVLTHEYYTLEPEEQHAVEEGLLNFATYFHDLWD